MHITLYTVESDTECYTITANMPRGTVRTANVSVGVHDVSISYQYKSLTGEIITAVKLFQINEYAGGSYFTKRDNINDILTVSLMKNTEMSCD